MGCLMLLMFFHLEHNFGDFSGGSVVKNPPANAGTQAGSLIQEDPTYFEEQLSPCTTAIGAVF